MKAVVGLGVVVSLAAAAIGYAATSNDPISTIGEAQHTVYADAIQLRFGELIASDAGHVRLSERAKALANQRVRMTGYVAKLELPPEGAFYLTAHPVTGDESGAGTSDLPLDSVLVEASTLARNAVQSIEGPVEVTGQLALAPAEDSQGRVHRIRLLLDSAISR